jgi:hypothetical protein
MSILTSLDPTATIWGKPTIPEAMALFQTVVAELLLSGNLIALFPG